LLDLVSDDIRQGELDLEGDADERSEQLMVALDGLNGRYGKGTIQVASAGMAAATPRGWGMRQERRTPMYTTRWAEVAIARA